MSSSIVLELSRMAHLEEPLSHSKTIEHIPIVLVTSSKKELRIVSNQRAVDDDISTGQVIHDRFYDSVQKGYWDKVRLQKPGIFIGTVQFDQALDIQEAILHPVPVRIETIEITPRKELERAFVNPAIAANWAPYTIAMDGEALNAKQVKALIIKSRPTKTKTRRCLGIARDWLFRIGMAVAFGELHNELGESNSAPAVAA